MVRRMAINPDTTVKKIIYLPKELWQAVDDYRFERRLKSEAEAVRRLLASALLGQSMADVVAEFVGIMEDPAAFRLLPEHVRKRYYEAMDEYRAARAKLMHDGVISADD